MPPPKHVQYLLLPVVIDVNRPDFVFAGISDLVCLAHLDNLRITCTPLSGECVTPETPPAYLGTYTFTTSADATGTFNVNIVEEPTTFLLDCEGTAISPLTLSHATVETPVAGDIDADCDVDLFDYEAFLQCVTGPGGGVDPGCEDADLDGDEDVDLIDWQRLQVAFTGSP